MNRSIVRRLLEALAQRDAANDHRRRARECDRRARAIESDVREAQRLATERARAKGRAA